VTNISCAVEGCDRTDLKATLCRMHYLRKWKTGSVGPAERIHDVNRERLQTMHCTAPDCNNPPRSLNAEYCEMHYCRLRRNGNLNAPQQPTQFRPKDQHPNWVGESVSYRAAHTRIATERGPASSYECIDCGSPAQHWSYDNSDPHERTEPTLGTPYSLDTSHYDPRCVRCHSLFDRVLNAVG
jgi:hypothetical protein